MNSSHSTAENGSYVSKRDQRLLSEARLTAAMQPDSGATQLVIDCSLSALMSAKEVEKLAMQIGRLYGANRRHPNPVHLWLAGLEGGGSIEGALKAKCDGFDAYKVGDFSNVDVDTDCNNITCSVYGKMGRVHHKPGHSNPHETDP